MPKCRPTCSVVRTILLRVGAASGLLAGSSLPVLAGPGPPSQSKLGIHHLAGYTPGTATVVQARPCVLKVMDIDSAIRRAIMRDYKAATPNGIVVLRQYTPDYFPLSEDPTAAANRFWNQVLAPPLNSLSASDKALIDYVEGPNEGDNCPTFGGAQYTNWFNTFWLALAPKIAAAGFKPCAFSIGVGHPAGDMPTILDAIDRIVPALRLIKSLGGAWSYHSYTIPYTTEYHLEKWYALRYHFYYQHFATKYPDLVNMPLILSEGGVDGQISPQGKGWRGGGDAAKYIHWLTWFDQQIRRDHYVLGVNLFTIGDPNWASFDLEPIAGWLAEYLRVQADPPTTLLTPFEIARTVEAGNNLSSDTFTVWNNTLGAGFNYELACDKDWLTINPPSAATTSTGVSHTIVYAVSELAEGVYTARITASPQQPNHPHALTIRVTVQPSPYAPADFDRDGDVDRDDYHSFESCATGPDIPLAVPACGKKDFDGDSDVDQSDFGVFQKCFSGANNSADPKCH